MKGFDLKIDIDDLIRRAEEADKYADEVMRIIFGDEPVTEEEAERKLNAWLKVLSLRHN